MKEQILEALAGSTADFTEIRVERRAETTVRFRGKELEQAGSGTDIGGFVRALTSDGGWGVATFNRLESLPQQVGFACECARSIKAEKIELALVEPVQDDIPVTLEEDFRNIPLATKKELIEEYNNIILSFDNRIRDTVVSYDDSFAEYYYANSEGTLIYEQRPQVVIRAMAIAREGDNIQHASASIGKPAGFEVARGMEAKVKETAARAVRLLEAEPVKGGKYTVICDPELAGVFIHEAFGHLSEADFIYENEKAREMMTLGRDFGTKVLNVADDGSVPGKRGTHKYDDEGTRTGKTHLIKEGKLVGRLHSRETAKKLGESPTGNARAISYRYAPIVRMTNTYIEQGQTLFEEMLSDIKEGIYACGTIGGQTMLENFSFSAECAFMIRDGKICEMVRDVVLGGNLFQTLANIEAIGSDFRWIERGGGCGKGGQVPLPVTMGAPHIRIRDVVIGGR